MARLSSATGEQFRWTEGYWRRIYNRKRHALAARTLRSNYSYIQVDLGKLQRRSVTYGEWEDVIE